MKMFSLCFILIYFVFLCSIFSFFSFFPSLSFYLFLFLSFPLLPFIYLFFSFPLLFFVLFILFPFLFLFYLFFLFIFFFLIYFILLVQVGQIDFSIGRFISSRIHPFPSEHGSKDAQSLLSTIMFTQMGTSGNLPFWFVLFCFGLFNFKII